MIHGPDSPDKPPKALRKEMEAHASYTSLPLFPKHMTYLLTALVGVAIIVHFLGLFRKFFPRIGKKFSENACIAFLIALIRSVAYLRLKPLGLIEFSPMHSIIICLAFAVGTIAWIFAEHPYYHINREWGPPQLGMRAGGLAIALFPFMYATALKINPISFLTGMSHARLQVYHQNFARIMLFLAIVHAVPFIHQPLKDAGYQNLKAYYYSTDRYWSGTVAIFFVLWMVLSSFGVFRKLSYTFFVVQHIISAVVVITMLFIHVHKTYMAHAWLWSSVALWIFSILGRSLITVYSTWFFTSTKALVEVQTEISPQPNERTDQGKSGMETFRLTMNTPLRWMPGQHVFVRFPELNPFEAHPFTIASLPSRSLRETSTATLVVRVHDGITRKIFNRVEKAESEEKPLSSGSGSSTLASSPKDVDIEKSNAPEHPMKNKDATSFAMNSVKHEIPTMHVKSSSIRAWIDGPYGSVLDPAMFDDSIFVAGGSGAAFVFPILLNLLRQISKGGRALTKRVRFIWTMRSAVMIGWMAPFIHEIMELRSAADIPVDISFFVSIDQSHEYHKLWDNLDIQHGARPDIPKELSDEFEMAKTSHCSSACVYTCGPSLLAVDVGNRVSKANLDVVLGRMGSLKDIALESETFGW